MPIKSQHIMICRTDNIGDVILTLPLTAYLKQHFPSIKISFLCRAYAAPVVRFCQTVDQIVELETLDDPVAYFSASDIDTIVFAQPDKRLAIAAHKANVPNRIGNTYRTWFNWFHCNWRLRFSKGSSTDHEAQLNFHYLRPLGCNAIPDRDTIKNLYHFAIPRDPALEHLISPYAFNLIIHPKSNGHGREWPIEHYVALAHLLSTNQDLHLWVSGSAAEGLWIEKHAPELLQLSNVTNVCGQFTLQQFSEFIHMADGLIASGTGPLHMSAAFGQRTIGLFPGARSMNPSRWGALGARAQSLCQPVVDCQGCKTKNAMTCACMKNILPATVAKTVLQWLTEKRISENTYSTNSANSI
ncbi:glycosyltransferase family 9 protein [Glaciimonas soli]|uniref:Glycosyl transferase n=1 Tax=Glaciimonas soli TaxID=2590999 RepID=A0A843YR07_9BURK|nr:glycosyltransferase family 9 protein [Glaciimonas soli]MQR00164.1 glycosyl transferase [Glaciimonas soli]